jgi:peptidyl-prolyl cis-trans isomerase C
MRIRQKTIFLPMTAACCLLGVITATAFGEKISAPKKAAVVNGTVITDADVDREMAALRQQLAVQGKAPSEDQLGAMEKTAVERLVNRELLYQASVSKGVKVDESTVEKRIGTIKERYKNDEEYHDALARMNLTEADVKSYIEKDATIEKFVDEQFLQKTSISEKETKDYYEANPDAFKKPEQVRARHILIKVEPDATEAQKAAALGKMETVRKRLEQGGDFESLAKEFSECPSAARGGDLGYFQRGQMVKPFEDVAFSMKPGETSDIVETQFGYHLIHVVDKQPESTVPYEEVKDKLANFMKEQLVRRQVSEFLEGERAKADVELFLDEKKLN